MDYSLSVDFQDSQMNPSDSEQLIEINNGESPTEDINTSKDKFENNYPRNLKQFKKGNDLNNEDDSESDLINNIRRQLRNDPESMTSGDLVSPDFSELAAQLSDQNLPEMKNNLMFDKMNPNLQMRSGLYSIGKSEGFSQPTISSQFFKNPRKTAPHDRNRTDSLRVSGIGFESIEKVSLGNHVIQTRVAGLVEAIKVAQQKSLQNPSLLKRQKQFDRLFFKMIDISSNKSINKEVIQNRTINFGDNQMYEMVDDTNLQLENANFKKFEENLKLKEKLMRVRFTDKFFPPIITSMVDDVMDTSFTELARLQQRRLGDVLRNVSTEQRIFPKQSKSYFSILEMS